MEGKERRVHMDGWINIWKDAWMDEYYDETTAVGFCYYHFRNIGVGLRQKVYMLCVQCMFVFQTLPLLLKRSNHNFPKNSPTETSLTEHLKMGKNNGLKRQKRKQLKKK